MDPIRVVDATEKVKNLWDKKIGLFFCLVSIVMFYFLGVTFFDKSYDISKSYNFSLPIILISVFIYWLINTHRILVKNPNLLGIYVCISCEEEFEFKAKNLFSIVIEELKRDKAFEILYVRLLPLNQFKNATEMENWLNKQNGDNNAIVFLNVKNGKINSDEKVNIHSISYSGFFKNNNLFIAGQNLNLINDLSLRLKDKDWSYFEKNSLDDKEKLRNNLKDLILYYGGLFYLNEGEFENSRILLKYLHNPELSVVKGKFDPLSKEPINIEVKTVNIQAGRLNYLLTHIYLKCVFDKFNNNQPKESIKLLKEVELFPCTHDIKKLIYMNFAYLYFITNDFENSKIYTRKMFEIDPRSFAYAINMGCYSIIENNPLELAKYYSLINENQPLDSQPVEIIGFLEDHLEKYPQSKILFEIGIAVLTKLFVEEVDGNNKLKTVIDQIPNGSQYKAIKKYCEKTLKQKWPKKVQRQRHKLRKAITE